MVDVQTAKQQLEQSRQQLQQQRQQVQQAKTSVESALGKLPEITRSILSKVGLKGRQQVRNIESARGKLQQQKQSLDVYEKSTLQPASQQLSSYEQQIKQAEATRNALSGQYKFAVEVFTGQRKATGEWGSIPQEIKDEAQRYVESNPSLRRLSSGNLGAQLSKMGLGGISIKERPNIDYSYEPTEGGGYIKLAPSGDVVGAFNKFGESVSSYRIPSIVSTEIPSVTLPSKQFASLQEVPKDFSSGLGRPMITSAEASQLSPSQLQKFEVLPSSGVSTLNVIPQGKVTYDVYNQPSFQYGDYSGRTIPDYSPTISLGELSLKETFKSGGKSIMEYGKPSEAPDIVGSYVGKPTYPYPTRSTSQYLTYREVRPEYVSKPITFGGVVEGFQQKVVSPISKASAPYLSKEIFGYERTPEIRPDISTSFTGTPSIRQTMFATKDFLKSNEGQDLFITSERPEPKKERVSLTYGGVLAKPAQFIGEVAKETGKGYGLMASDIERLSYEPKRINVWTGGGLYGSKGITIPDVPSKVASGVRGLGLVAEKVPVVTSYAVAPFFTSVSEFASAGEKYTQSISKENLQLESGKFYKQYVKDVESGKVTLGANERIPTLEEFRESAIPELKAQYEQQKISEQTLPLVFGVAGALGKVGKTKGFFTDVKSYEVATRDVLTPKGVIATERWVVGDQPLIKTVFGSKYEIKPPRIRYQTTRAREFFGKGPIGTPELLPVKMEKIQTIKEAWTGEPQVLSRLGVNENLITGRIKEGGKYLISEKSGALSFAERNIEDFSKLPKVEQYLWKGGKEGEATIFDLGSRRFTIETETKRLSRMKLLKDDSLNIYRPKVWKEGKGTTKQFSVLEVGPKIIDDEFLSLSRARSFTKDVSKPLSRARGKVGKMNIEIREYKQVKTRDVPEDFFKDLGGDVKIMSPSDVPKTPLSKSFLELEQKALKESLKQIPKVRQPKVDVGKAKLVSKSSESNLIGIPRMVGGTGAEASKFYGKGTYEVSEFKGSSLPKVSSNVLEPSGTSVGVIEPSSRGRVSRTYSDTLTKNIGRVKSDLGIKSKYDMKLRSSVRLASDLRTSPFIGIRPLERIKTDTRISSDVFSDLKTSQRIRTEPRTFTRGIPRTVTRKTSTPKPKPKKGFFFLKKEEPKKKLKSKKKKGFVEAFLPYVIRGKKEIIIGGLTTREEALRKGQKRARKTAAVTFGAKPTGKEIKGKKEKPFKVGEEFRTYKIVKGKKVPLVDMFIQKRKYRIKTLGEKSEITRKGQAKRRKEKWMG